mmetsp:Transcript_14054/g.17043  ORF Transcript_14054/g.17043 Transcript_14054/m.17043 type:complete len:146 (+) Transcript_14054:159-596(+)|eukprot:CAMPEP_0197860474 /NCGR_PEP_ID=MMETSP1438-20131217/35870_1 /TAXON_ID=1461541 /ORGANISM="Pterosperma sp., Strain CCMP1384" /LENGTH=145 /DNA_ID=CAMNT_0043477351 /DNA_START=156 /DNA_END=593 /DNA_ORIENTATION=-
MDVCANCGIIAPPAGITVGPVPVNVGPGDFCSSGSLLGDVRSLHSTPSVAPSPSISTWLTRKGDSKSSRTVEYCRSPLLVDQVERPRAKGLTEIGGHLCNTGDSEPALTAAVLLVIHFGIALEGDNLLTVYDRADDFRKSTPAIT